MTDIFTQDIKDLMKLATTDFDKFYKETEKANKDKGDSSTAASSGYSSTAASSGNYSKAASSGNSSTAASSGYYSTAASKGKHAACSSLGYRAAVSGDLGNLIMASEYVYKNSGYIPVGGKADIVDGKKLKPGCWYIVENKEWAEVDFTDGVFTRVISSRAGVKKVKDDQGRVLYIVSSGEFNAHGKTIKEAREALLFKTTKRDVSEYKNMPLTTKKPPAEWAVVYHFVTGACPAGCKMFMEKKGKLKKQYTLSEIIKETEGAYGHDKFVGVVKK